MNKHALLAACGFFSFASGANEDTSHGNDKVDGHPALRFEAGGNWQRAHYRSGRPQDTEGFQGKSSFAQRIGNFAIQADIAGSAHFRDYSDFSSVGGIGHLGWRDEAIGMLGIVGSYNTGTYDDRNRYYDAFVDLESSSKSFSVGVEGEWFLSDITIGAKGFYSSVETTTTAVFRNLRYPSYRFRSERGSGYAYARYYIDDNFKVEIGGGATPSTGVDLYSVHAATEFKFPDLPLSLFARWDGAFLDYDRGISGTTSDIQGVMAGFRLYFFGLGDTIKHYDRSYFAE